MYIPLLFFVLFLWAVCSSFVLYLSGVAACVVMYHQRSRLLSGGVIYINLKCVSLHCVWTEHNAQLVAWYVWVAAYRKSLWSIWCHGVTYCFNQPQCVNISGTLNRVAKIKRLFYSHTAFLSQEGSCLCFDLWKYRELLSGLNLWLLSSYGSLCEIHLFSFTKKVQSVCFFSKLDMLLN